MGKTSTTGLLAHVLSGINPTSYLIGMALTTANQMLISLHLKREYRRHFWLIHQIMRL